MCLLENFLKFPCSWNIVLLTDPFAEKLMHPNVLIEIERKVVALGRFDQSRKKNCNIFKDSSLRRCKLHKQEEIGCQRESECLRTKNASFCCAAAAVLGCQQENFPEFARIATVSWGPFLDVWIDSLLSLC